MFPTHRPRRLRANPMIRDLVRETQLHPHDLVFPLFVQEETDEAVPIVSMPGQFRHSIPTLLRACEDAAEAGVRSVLLFGIPNHKDPEGSQAFAEDGIVQRAFRALKARGLPLLLMGDVCMCEYTSHGHCGHVDGHNVHNDKSLDMLVKTAVSQARAGADLVAPSDMMDGRVAAIRGALDAAGYVDTGILAYSAKYASAFYGPFREALDSAPRHGDKQTYQMDPGNSREAVREARLDAAEGADLVMVKPALAYLDVIAAVRRAVELPVAAYNVSGEYAMVKAAAANGWVDEATARREMLVAIKRAGADVILSYWALEVARELSA